MEKEYKRMNRAYCKILSYNEKLTTEYSLNDEDLHKLQEIRDKCKYKFAKRLFLRIRKEDW